MSSYSQLCTSLNMKKLSVLHTKLQLEVCVHCVCVCICVVHVSVCIPTASCRSCVVMHV